MKDCIAVTEQGKIRGRLGWDPRITVFKGIPYAAPPVGKKRWCAPLPPEKWEGIREADEFGPMAMQNRPGVDPADFWTREIHPAAKRFRMSEDCLYLNVFTPAEEAGEKLPVLFYIHGGGYLGGYGYEIEFDWEHMARKGIVCVSINYRLGVLGFISHPWLSEEYPEEPKGNYGVQDQLAALQWVKRNIAAFGGDPDRITIAGQSAGCGSVQCLLNTPLSDGLIAGAILESGASVDMPDLPDPLSAASLETAEAVGSDFFAKAGIHSLEEARKIPAEQMISLVNETLGPTMFFKPTIDGIFLMETNSDGLIRGKWKDVPVIAGFNRGEMKAFHRFSGKLPENADELKQFSGRYGESAEEFLEIFGAQDEAHVRQVFDGDAYDYMLFANRFLGCCFAKQGKKAYLYQFDADIPGTDDHGSFHGSELWYAYDSIARAWRPFTGKDYDLSRKISSYWVNFVKTGDPNGSDTFGEKLPEWPVFSPENEKMLLFTDQPQEISVATSDLMKFRMENKEKQLGM